MFDWLTSERLEFGLGSVHCAVYILYAAGWTASLCGGHTRVIIQVKKKYIHKKGEKKISKGLIREKNVMLSK
jgi:hypothetical protein